MFKKKNIEKLDKNLIKLKNTEKTIFFVAAIYPFKNILGVQFYSF